METRLFGDVRIRSHCPPSAPFGRILLSFLCGVIRPPSVPVSLFQGLIKVHMVRYIMMAAKLRS
jgi:hypothetical protein